MLLRARLIEYNSQTGGLCGSTHFDANLNFAAPRQARSNTTAFLTGRRSHATKYFVKPALNRHRF